MAEWSFYSGHPIQRKVHEAILAELESAPQDLQSKAKKSAARYLANRRLGIRGTKVGIAPLSPLGLIVDGVLARMRPELERAQAERDAAVKRALEEFEQRRAEQKNHPRRT